MSRPVGKTTKEEQRKQSILFATTTLVDVATSNIRKHNVVVLVEDFCNPYYKSIGTFSATSIYLLLIIPSTKPSNSKPQV